MRKAKKINHSKSKTSIEVLKIDKQGMITKIILNGKLVKLKYEPWEVKQIQRAKERLAKHPFPYDNIPE